MEKRFLLTLFLMAVLPLAAYEVIVFGDVHFDSTAVRDPKEKRPRYQIEETKRNLAAWSPARIPAMLDRAGKKVTPQTALVIQLGDIVQGDFGSRERHRKALDLVLAEFQKRFPAVPFVMIPGNHDGRGPGAQQAYQEKIIPYLNRTLNLKLPPGKPVQYVWTKERDLFVMLDFNQPDAAFLERAVASHPDLRHLIVLTHFPVIPTSYPGAVCWLNMSPAERRKFIRLLAKHHAVVLTAHIHKTTRIEWQCPQGSITQLSLSGIVPAKPEARSVKKRDCKNPLPKLSAEWQRKAGKKVPIIQAEFLSGYRLYADILPGSGFAVLKLNGKGVTAELYHGKGLKPTERIKLKSVLLNTPKGKK